MLKSMKITYDDQLILELTDHHMSVLAHEISDEKLSSDLIRRLLYIVQHPCDLAINAYKGIWRTDLGALVETVPTDGMKLAALADSHGLLPSGDGIKDSTIEVNGSIVGTVTALQKKLFKLGHSTEEDLSSMDGKIVQQLQWILVHKYEHVLGQFRDEWEKKLGDSVPIDAEKFAKLVFAHPEYKNRSQRDKEVYE